MDAMVLWRAREGVYELIPVPRFESEQEMTQLCKFDLASKDSKPVAISHLGNLGQTYRRRTRSPR